MLDRPRVMAIVNVTPDSFSDGGAYPSTDDVVRAAARMLEQGADLLDLGGESTRPGAHSVAPEEQIRRVVPAIVAIRRELGDAFPITIDTTRSAVARAAFDAGADALNDISAASDDPEMLPMIARKARGVVLMHRLRPSASDRYSTQYLHPPQYRDQASSGSDADGQVASGVVEVVGAYLRDRLAASLAAGIARGAIVLDPGLGFGKSVDDNLRLIARTRELCALGCPVLSGLSRKSFTAHVGGVPSDRPMRDRVSASVGLSIAHLHAGAMIFRVHDVAEHVQALRSAWSTIGVQQERSGVLAALPATDR